MTEPYIPSNVPLAELAAAVHERWAIKTGADDGAANIDTSAPTDTSIEWLRSQPAPPPDHLKADARHGPVETTVYKLSATLTAYQQESDQDYHLVLSSDQAGITMIAEIPDPAAAAKGCHFLPQITAARKAFEDRFRQQLAALAQLQKQLEPTAAGGMGEVAMIRNVRVPVTITGIGFFDFIHGQTGVAPNGVELHPVLSIAFD